MFNQKGSSRQQFVCMLYFGERDFRVTICLSVIITLEANIIHSEPKQEGNSSVQIVSVDRIWKLMGLPLFLWGTSQEAIAETAKGPNPICWLQMSNALLGWPDSIKRYFNFIGFYYIVPIHKKPPCESRFFLFLFKNLPTLKQSLLNISLLYQLN